jgi:hypothetical protein
MSMLSRAVELQAAHPHQRAGLYAQKHTSGNRVEVSPLYHPTDKEHNTGIFGHIQREDWGNIGVYVTSAQTAISTLADIEDL